MAVRLAVPGPLLTKAKPVKHRVSFATKMLLQQVLVILLVVGLATGVYAWLSYQRLTAEVGSKSLAVAQSISEDSTLISTLTSATGTPRQEVLQSGPIQQLAETVRGRTDALFIVVTDADGIRWSHPNPRVLGQLVSTSPDAALNGDEITIMETGTLGPSVRSKVPVRTAQGHIVGEVSVGYSTADVRDALVSSIPPIVGVGVAALLLGVLGSSFLGRRLRAHTLGLEPEEIGALVQDQEVVLHGVEEGVLGLSPAGLVTVCNTKAQRLLGLHDPIGVHYARLGLDPALLELIDHPHGSLEEGPATSHQLMAGQSILLVSVRRVHRGAHDLGSVVMVRDRTDVQALSRQLDAVGTLTSALRAQRHEFANRLHTVSGFLELGYSDEAAEYLRSTLETGPLRYPLENAQLLTDTYLLAFLGAKSTQAAEKGVTLRLGENTVVRGLVTDAHSATTVLGNLVDNAITAAVQGSNPDRWVEIELLSDGPALHVTVADSGDGIAAASRQRLFEDGASSTSPVTGVGRGEGLGLALARQLARLDGGDVWVLFPGAPEGPGAVFAARLEDVLDCAKDTDD